eukprot:CAMPEP_0177612356 /NCGR_PEP_ID=MMETSP0419_2-20121207/21160_1 /TAXON_ID=582737 /ORGANISM="Tetraselmis sp., Strain GSL018" /LENGTH=69 /DNA_ID=CAMNT_0019108505 /DNA_START=80 /DNA_END=286 /DNA_ORIENTATION=-
MNHSGMRDFSSISAAKTALSDCSHAAKSFYRLAHFERWEFFSVLRRSVRKVQPFFLEAYKAMKRLGVRE